MILIPNKISENLIDFSDVHIGEYFFDKEQNLYLKISHKLDEYNVVWINYGTLQCFSKDQEVTIVIVDHTVSEVE